MRILFDPQALSLGNSGMYRYYSSLLKGLMDFGIDVFLPQKNILFDRNAARQTFFQSLIPSTLIQPLKRLNNYHTRRSYYKAIASGQFDLLYITSPNFETNFLQYLNDKPFVMTVHDTMQTHRVNYSFLDQHRDTHSLGYLAHLAERVICVSNHTQNDLCNKFLVDREKTDIVYLADFLNTEATDVVNLPEKYILFVGSRTGRKNFFEWIKAVAPMLSRHPSLNVVVTGACTEAELFFCRKFSLEKKLVSVENVTDAQLVTLYQNAICLVYPSLYEGFGLPVLEAMGKGCPVITSSHTSLPEVADTAALLIDPLNPEEMLCSLKKMIEQDDLRQRLIKKGFEQSKKFSKEKFISGTISVFEKAVRGYQKQP